MSLVESLVIRSIYWPVSDATSTTNIADERPAGEHWQYGRVLVIPDVAFRTLKAFIYYLYSGQVNFAPLSSWPHLSSSNAMHASKAQEAPLCSAKSMYRLADKYGLVALRDSARLDIASKLRAENIVTELRSSLTSTYEQIRDIEVNYACERSRQSIVLPAMSEWILELSKGNIAYSANTLVSVYRRTATLPAPPDTRTECTGCRTHSLATNQTIFRYCSRCQNYRNPM
ncbi:hypothetical protein BC629DRAFT_1456201 [Irpex lacteus]|nr:hypothetical protein BC629DRAFT_1456201 [Irpex lacteus]